MPGTEAVKITTLLTSNSNIALDRILSGIVDHLPKSCELYEKTHTVHEVVLIWLDVHVKDAGECIMCQ